MVHCISLSSCHIPQHWFSLIDFFFYNSINSTTTSGMNPSKEYRIWSLISRGYLVLTKNGDNTPTLDCTGTGEEQTSESEFVAFPLHFIVTVEKKWFFTSERSFRHHVIACIITFFRWTWARFMATLLSNSYSVQLVLNVYVTPCKCIMKAATG